MADKNYLNLSGLSKFLDNLKTLFATKTAVDEIISEHTHSYDDLRNKPFYEGTDYSSILPDNELTTNFYDWSGGVYGAAVTDAPKAFTQDVSHKVIWDGIEYTLTSTFSGNNEAGNPITSLGAPYGNYSTYPFGIDSYKTASGTYEFSIHTNSTNATHTIDILELGSSFVTLDERFIPDSIARNSYVEDSIDNLSTTYETKTDASLKLSEAKIYADSAISVAVDNINADHLWNLIYDSGTITTAINSFANISTSGYNNFMVAVTCVNNGNPATRAASVIFRATNGTTYQFPVMTNLFSASSVTNGAMANFKIANGHLVCLNANRVLNNSNFLTDTEGGTTCNLNGIGGGIMKCTNVIQDMTISSLDQNASYYFGAGSRLMIWGWKA